MLLNFQQKFLNHPIVQWRGKRTLKISNRWLCSHKSCDMVFVHQLQLLLPRWPQWCSHHSRTGDHRTLKLGEVIRQALFPQSTNMNHLL